jgi:cytochrome c oxidase subunit 2
LVAVHGPDTDRQALGADRARVWLVGGGVVFPAAVLSALFVYEMARWPVAAATGGPGDVVVSVTGKVWWWEVRYPNPSGGPDIVLANEIHLPAGRPVVVGLNSTDVIHSFWVPSLAGKVDAVPGRVQQLRLDAVAPGVYRAPCAEFCGDQHAKMTALVVVETPADFERWLRAQAAPAVAPDEPDAVRGRAVFEAQRCAGCHTIRGLFDGTDAGPDLTHVGSRRFLGAGTVPADAAGFVQWIGGVQHLKAGARMPSYDRLDAQSLSALAAFLAALR